MNADLKKQQQRVEFDKCWTGGNEESFALHWFRMGCDITESRNGQAISLLQKAYDELENLLSWQGTAFNVGPNEILMSDIKKYFELKP